MFLVDLTRDKPTCRRVKVAPPDIVPELAKEGWTTTVQRAVERLKAASSEVKEFLEPVPKQ